MKHLDVRCNGLHVSPSRKGRLNAGGTHLRCLKKTEGYLYETPRKAQDASR